MPYIGNPIYQAAFVTDQFSGDGTTTAYTMSVAPAGTTNVLVVVSGVVQDPSTYGVVGNTLTFSAAPPSGTGNISCRYLGVPVTGVTTTAYRTVTEFTATAGQTTFTPPSYNVGFINVYRNGVLLGSADYTATNGTTVVLATGASAGNLVTVESFQISSVANAIPNAAGAVTSSNIQTSVALTTPTMTSPTITSGPLTIGTTALGAGNASIMKNRIINGAMVINQRATAVTATGYVTDRFQYQSSQNSKGTAQQSTTAPVGFNNSLQFTSSSAYSVLSTDYFALQQVIEGYNVADLGWGTVNAKTVTLSFQVYSSLTGTFGGSLINGANNRSYPFSYSVPVANTWTTVSITIAGDTTGTWATDNSAALKVWFSLGAGSNYNGTVNTWAGALYFQPSGATSVVGTNGATFYITGVQLEVGSSATGFEYRQYQQELALCQRYYQILGAASGFYYSPNNSAYLTVNYTMRATPSAAIQGTILVDYAFGTPGSYTSVRGLNVNQYGGELNLNMGTSSGMTNGQYLSVYTNIANSGVAFSAEL